MGDVVDVVLFMVADLGRGSLHPGLIATDHGHERFAGVIFQ